MSEDLMGRVIQVIAAAQHIPAETITPESTFEELKIDSLDGINILFGLESEFDISIPDEAGKNLRTVRELAEGVSRLLGDA